MMQLPWFLGNSGNSPSVLNVSILVLLIWTIVMTGLALWHAARRGDRGWFVLFLIVHTAGLLELLYLIFVARSFSQKGKSSGRK